MVPQQVYMSIREVADECEISARTLRYYEQLGLIRPAGRTESGRRYYTPEVIADVKVVSCYKQMGFRLRDLPGFCEKCSGCGECGSPEPGRNRVMLSLLTARKERITKLLSGLQNDLARVEHGLAVLQQEPQDAAHGTAADRDPTADPPADPLAL